MGYQKPEACTTRPQAASGLSLLNLYYYRASPGVVTRHARVRALRVAAPADVLFSGLSPQFIGLNQINVTWFRCSSASEESQHRIRSPSRCSSQSPMMRCLMANCVNSAVEFSINSRLMQAL